MEQSVSVSATNKKDISPGLIIMTLILMAATAYMVYQIRAKKKSFVDASKGLGKLIASPTGVVAILGFMSGLTEYIVADNVNTFGFKDSVLSPKSKLFRLPEKEKLMKTATTLAVASFLTGLATDAVLRLLPPEAKDNVSRKYLG